VFFTDGRYGDPGLAERSGDARRSRETELVAARKQEALRALAVLGVQEHHFLDETDGSLASHAPLVARVRGIIEAFEPEYVYLPFFLDHHPDHRAVTQILLDATSGLRRDFACVAYEVWAPLWPNCLVRIDAQVDAKRRALLEYRSQVAHCDYVHHSLGLNAYRAAPLDDARTRYAEAFCMLPLSRYAALARAVSPQPAG
jgi:LmbE family N-acetylglucosaminyl deacetylase